MEWGCREVFDAVGGAEIGKFGACELGTVVADQCNGHTQPSKQTTENGNGHRRGDTICLDDLRPFGEGIDDDEVIVAFDWTGVVDVDALPWSGWFGPRHRWRVRRRSGYGRTMSTCLDEVDDIGIQTGPIHVASGEGLHTLHAGMATMKLFETLLAEQRRDDEPFGKHDAPIYHGERFLPDLEPLNVGPRKL